MKEGEKCVFSFLATVTLIYLMGELAKEVWCFPIMRT